MSAVIYTIYGADRVIAGYTAYLSFFQGYLLAAMSHIHHGRKNLALDYFLKGFKIALEPSLFLVEIVRCLVTLKSSKGTKLL